MTDCYDFAMEKQVTFGDRLREAMAAKGFNQEQLAEAIGSTQSHVSLLARGKRNPSSAMVKAIAMALECDADKMLLAAGFAPEQPPRPSLGVMGDLGELTYPLTDWERGVLDLAKQAGIGIYESVDPDFWEQEPSERRGFFRDIEGAAEEILKFMKRKGKG